MAPPFAVAGVSQEGAIDLGLRDGNEPDAALPLLFVGNDFSRTALPPTL
jgi:hypothetical protein